MNTEAKICEIWSILRINPVEILKKIKLLCSKFVNEIKLYVFNQTVQNSKPALALYSILITFLHRVRCVISLRRYKLSASYQPFYHATIHGITSSLPIMRHPYFASIPDNHCICYWMVQAVERFVWYSTASDSWDIPLSCITTISYCLSEVLL